MCSNSGLVRRHLTRVTLAAVLLAVAGQPALRAQAQAPATAAPAALPVAQVLPPRGPATAPVVILLFSDFECPYCARVDPILEEVRKTFQQEVQVVFKHNPLPIHPNAPLAHEAAAEAARQGRFWEMHDLLFARQRELQLPFLLERAQKLGLDMAAFRNALETRVHRASIERDMAEARALGVTGTPTLFVAGQRLVGVPTAPQLTTFVKSLLSGAPVADAGGAITLDSLDFTGSPTRGPATAPVTIVEFSDFQCPFCAQAVPVMDQVSKAYGDKVRWVFKHNPLDFHADAPLAHRAALAAGEQGKFWEMHDAIFRSQRALKRDDLLRHAATLGLDAAKFTADLESPAFKTLIERDLAEGLRAGVDGTPTFFVNGRRMTGARPFEAFRALIDRELGVPERTVAVRPAAGTEIPAAAMDLAMSRGPQDARVKIRWYADFGSPLHRDAVAVLKRVLASHPSDVQLIFNHRPLEGRPEAWLLHEAAASAAEQGRFWDVHDLLLTRSVEDKATLVNYVGRLGLDRDWFEESLSSGRARATVARHLTDAGKLDVKGTPTFFVNDVRLDGVVAADVIESAISKELSRLK